jgi:hypothetical protein
MQENWEILNQIQISSRGPETFPGKFSENRYNKLIEAKRRNQTVVDSWDLTTKVQPTHPAIRVIYPAHLRPWLFLWVCTLPSRLEVPDFYGVPSALP